MKTKILLFLLCLSSLSMMGQNENTQGTIQRKKKQTTQNVTPKPKPKPTPTPKPKPTPTPHATPEAAGYDVTFTCNVPSASLYIDGNANGNASGTRFLKTGSHNIRVTANGYEDYSRSITVNSSSRSFSFSLVKNTTPFFLDQTITVKGVSFQMIAVHGGTFTMGATYEQGNDADENEEPAHTVTLSDYYMGKFEVSQALWKAVMDTNPSYFKGDDLPVEMVSWNDCQSFIHKLNSITGKTFRLPTEAEWEFAAKGGIYSKDYKYSGSNSADDVAWYWGNCNEKTHSVGSKSPNELGLYDMSGNVFEWCNDWYGSYTTSYKSDPTGPAEGPGRVLRGGSVVGDADWCRTTYRGGGLPPNLVRPDLGFRLILVR